MQVNLEEQLKEKLTVLVGNKNIISKECLYLENLVAELEAQLDETKCPKSKLIQKSAEVADLY